MDWRSRWAEKLVSPEDAVRIVKSGDRVFAGMFTGTPPTLCRALFERHDELRGVTIFHYIAPFVWATPEAADAFRVRTVFAGAADRQAVRDGRADYVPVANFRQSWIKETMGEVNVMLARTSPPDENGYMSFGSAVWIGRTVADIAARIICEVDETFIRTYGENFLHISEVDYLCEHDARDAGTVSVPARSEENANAAEVICTLVASELIRDGDTLQLGLGDVTTAMALYLDDKHDLGIQTELIPGGVIDLVKKGVVTGRKKEVAPGKVVGSAFAVLPPEELRYAHMNPAFELWDFCHTDDMRILVREEAFVAINNALQIDLTGQVTAETLNGEIYSGPGGQTTFAVAASVCEDGRSIIALPSSSTVNGIRHSRILPVLPPGSVVTTPRSFVDYVVTEYGIATLRGKTLRERAGELIAVAHPDFQPGLRAEAKRRLHL